MAASDWIKMRHNLGTDPDVITIACKTGLDEFGVVGRLHAVWSWLDQHSDDGTNVPVTSAFLDRLSGCAGFADAMRAVGWLEGRDGSLSFPGYLVHNGTTGKFRAVETKRKAVQREEERKKRDTCPDRSGTGVPPKPGPEERREEEKREGGKSAGAHSPPLPDFEDSEEFSRAVSGLHSMWADAPAAFSSSERMAMQVEHALLMELTADDWAGLAAWTRASLRDRNQTRVFPRDRLEFLRNLSEVVTKVRPWWRNRNRLKPTLQVVAPSDPGEGPLSREEIANLLHPKPLAKP